jgi:hypothetical protein
VSFFRIPSPSGGAERAKKGRTSTCFMDLVLNMNLLSLLSLCRQSDVSMSDLQSLLLTHEARIQAN